MAYGYSWYFVVFVGLTVFFNLCHKTNGQHRYLREETLSVALSEQQGKDKSWCIQMRDKYQIEPGRSFGSLPREMHNLYLQARCHRFFCKPHPLAGKGVYKCEPLDES